MKDDRSPLTMADRRSHEIIERDLATSYVGGVRLPLLSEEGKSIAYGVRRHWNLFWLIDPLDGTKEFIKRNGEFTVNIALIHAGRPVLGIIHAPVRGTLYFAARGAGAYLLDNRETLDALRHCRAGNAEENGFQSILNRAVRLQPRKRNGDMSAITVVGSRSHGSDELDRLVSRLAARYGRVEMVSAGSSLKFCMVAEGSADLYVRHGPTMEWDIAAGQIIVEESGGAVMNMTTLTEMEYNKESLVNPAFAVTGGGLPDIAELL